MEKGRERRRKKIGRERRHYVCLKWWRNIRERKGRNVVGYFLELHV